MAAMIRKSGIFALNMRRNLWIFMVQIISIIVIAIVFVISIQMMDRTNNYWMITMAIFTDFPRMEVLYEFNF